MCSEFQINTNARQVEDALGAPVKVTGGNEWNQTVKFSARAPVITFGTGGFELVERVFPVSPFPNARLSGFANQTDAKDDGEPDETELRRIYQVPRWKKAFGSSPYLIPMTGFTEYAYWGEQAGSALNFRLPKQDVFFAAGIETKPFIPRTGRDDGFAILTHTATKQMLSYHQRLIVLLKPEFASGYLDEMSPEARFNYLIEYRYTGELEVEKLRTMAKGWEKRAATQNLKLSREQSYREKLATEKVDG